MSDNHDPRAKRPPVTTTGAGIPAASDEHSLTVGASGPILLQDHDLRVSNIVGRMADGVERLPQERAVALWRRVAPDLCARIAGGLGLVPRGALLETDTR